MPVLVFARFLHRLRAGASRVTWPCVLLAALGLLACGGASNGTGSAPLDDFGQPVRAAGARAPQRIVSLSPATTEILFAIGAGPRVVGRSRYDLWPPAARSVPEVGPGLQPNIEAILARRPDLVVLYASADNRPAADRLRSAGVAVLALRSDRLSDFRRALTLIGRATGDSARAALVSDTVSATLDRVARATAALPRPRVFWHIWTAPPITIGAGSFLSDLVRIAGGTNVYDDLSAPSPRIALEDLVRRDPDVILAGPEGARALRASPAWRAVPAVRAGRILVVDTSLVARPSVRLGEAAVSLARLLHPGVMP